MKRNKKAAVVMGLLMATTVSAGAAMLTMTGCDPEPPVTTTHTLGNGDYYQDVNGVEHKLTINGSSFVMAFGAEERTGTYTYDGASAITFKFSDDNTTVEASYDDGSISFTYNGVAYELIPMTEFTVTFELNGGTGTGEVKVINGRTIEKPANPTKTGQVFVGWYSDAAFAKAFDFENTPITGNIKLYARYVARAEGEFTLSFDAASAGQTIADVKTAGKQVFDSMLPVLEAKDGKQFLGWWTSDYEDGTKLTAEVADGQTVDENMTLYAVWEGDVPALSVNGTGISWSSAGVGAQYRLTVTGPDGDKIVNDRAESGTSMALDFSAQAAGDYVVTLTVNGKTATAYYKNKGLARVSLFSVEGSVLTFNEVAGATAYYISVDCDNPAHNTNEISLEGAAYDFSECNMESGPIKFTVRATAEGYVDSVAEYSFERTLGTTAVSVDSATDKLTWTAVENAESYKVTVKSGDATDSVTVNANQENSVDLSKYYGELEISVTPYNHGWLSPEAAQTTYNKTRLATPSNIRASGNSIVWDEVEDAISYTVTINGKVQTVTSASIDLSGQELDDIVVTVQAVAADAINSSFKSSAQTIARAITGLEYDGGAISWNSVIGAVEYGVRINGGEIVNVGNVVTCPVTLTKAGTNTIEVGFYEDDKITAWEKITVSAETLTLDHGDGINKTELFYVAGDTITLPEKVDRTGYTFVTWATALTGGQAVTSGGIFDGDTTYYAQWTANQYEVKLVVPAEEGAFSDGTNTITIKVTYGEEFEFAVPNSAIAEKAFNGWRVQGNDTLVSDPDGNGLFVWDIAEASTLYATWIDAYTFREINHPTETGKKAYAVSQGAGSRMMTKMRVPAVYNNLPVTTVEAGCFANCSNLQTVEIPDSIVSIVVSSEGSSSTGSAFQGCNNLKSVVIYDAKDEMGTERPYEVYYSSSDDGLLIREKDISNVNAGVELVFVPRGIKGEVHIPEGVQIIPQYVFKSTEVSTIYIPYTVKEIRYRAFASDAITSVVFEETPEDKEEVPLTIADEAFAQLLGSTSSTYNYEHVASITELTLPSRITEIRDAIFQDVVTLKKLNISGEGGKYTSEDGMILTDSGKTLFYCPRYRDTAVIIPDSVRVIAESAFYGCKNITSVEIHAEVQEIGKEAFRGCSGITKLLFEDDADGADLIIREYAFYSCTGLSEVVLPANLVTLEAHAFGATSHLFTVTVNASREGIDYADGAFLTDADVGTGYVKSLIIGPNVKEINIIAIFGSSNLNSVEVDPANDNFVSSDALLSADGKRLLYYFDDPQTTSYTVPDTVEVISTGVFAAAENLKTVVIGPNVKVIEDNAFYKNASIEEIIFTETPAGAQQVELTIGDRAFYGNDALTSITLPERTVSIGAYAFYSCDGFTSFVVPEGVKTIGDMAFANCSRLKTITLPTTLEEVGDGFEDISTMSAYTTAINIFYNSENLAEIKMNDGGKKFGVVQNVLYEKDDEGDYSVLAFSPYLNEGENGVITVPDTVSSTRDAAFFNSSRITRIVFGNLEEGKKFTFGKAVFATDYSAESALESLRLPQGLTEIPDKMFAETLIKEITIPNTVTKIGVQAFYKCLYLETVTFEDGGTAPLEIADGTMSSGTGFTTYYGTFSGCVSLKSIVLPERLTKIGAYAFSSGNAKSGTLQGFEDIIGIKSINIPSTVTNIGQYAFVGAVNLTEVKFAQKNANGLVISNNAFVNTSLGDVVLPEGTTKVGVLAFSESTITSIYFPSSLTTLEAGQSTWGVFYGCDKLTTVTFAENCQLTEVPDYLFNGLKTLKSVNLENCVVLTGIGQMSFYGSGITSIKIPATVQTLDLVAFASCRDLTTVEMLTKADKDGVQRSDLTTMGNRVFEDSAITSFKFPESTAETVKLGTTIFNRCYDLTKLELATYIENLTAVLSGTSFITELVIPATGTDFKLDPNGSPLVLDIDGTTIYSAYGYVLGENSDGTYRIPEGITAIAASAFAGQNTIKTLVLPASLNQIGAYAFENCRSLQTIQFASEADIKAYAEAHPEVKEEDLGLKSIGNYAFTCCSYLGAVTIPDTVTSIGLQAFSYSGITEVTIPSSVTTIGNNLFYNCVNLTKATINATYSSGGSTLFSGCTALAEVTLGQAFGQITSSMFKGCTSLKSIDARYVTKINANAFQDSGLERIVLGERLEEIGNTAFDGCLALTTVGYYTNSNKTIVGEDNEVVLPVSVVKLGNSVFQETAITKVTLGENLTSLGTNLFKNSKVQEAYLNLKGVTKLSNNMFDACASLKKVVLSQYITETGTYVFRDCLALKTVQYYGEKDAVVGEENVATIPGSLTTFGNYTFSETGLEKVVIANNVDKFGTYVFSACEQLKYVDLTGCAAELGNYMFRNCISLTEVIMPDITAIGTAASAYTFAGCESLHRVVLGSSLTEINNYAFQNCVSLSIIDITNNGNTTRNEEGVFSLPSSLTTLGNYAFQNTAVVEITLPASVTKIGTATNATTTASTFADCLLLEKVVLGNLLTNIGRSAFDGCINLKTVQYADQANNIFGEEGELTLPASVSTLGNQAFYETAFTKVVVPATVTTIGTNVFGYCDLLTSAEYLTTATNTGTFTYCTALKSVVIPAELTSIPASMFSHCEVLTTIGTYSATNKTYDLEDGKVKLPAGITSIGDSAFLATKLITELTLPAGLKTIGYQAFLNCGIDSLVIPASVITIGQNAINCGSVTVESGNTAYFTQLGALASAGGVVTYIPGSIGGEFDFTQFVGAKIGGYALNTSNITKIILTPDQLSSNCFTFFDGEIVIKPAADSEETLLTTSRLFAGYEGTTIVLPYNLTEIGISAFADCANLTTVKYIDADGTIHGEDGKVTLPESLKELPSSLFEGCSSITSIVLGEKTILKAYASSIFSGCSSLKEVTIPVGTTYIGGYMFEDCSSLESLVIPEGVTSIGNNAFDNCTSLKSISLPSTLTSLSSAFNNCTALESITIPENVTTLSTISGCTALTKVVYNAINVTTTYSSGYPLFKDCGAITELVVGENVKKIPRAAFMNQTNLKKVTLPEGLTAIEGTSSAGAFANTGLTEVVIPTTAVGGGYYDFSYAFENCKDLVTVYIPSTLTSLGTHMFSGCTSLRNVWVYELDENGEMKILSEQKQGLVDLSYMPDISDATNCFENCSSIESVLFNDAITLIPIVMFGNSGLKSVTIPESVTSITSAFQGCTQMESITLHARIITVFSSAFTGWTEDQKVIIYMYAADSGTDWRTGWMTGCNAQIEYHIVYGGDIYGNPEEEEQGE